MDEVGRRRRAARALVGLAAFVACVGCGTVDAASLAGEYVAREGEGGLTLAADGTFAAAGVPAAVLEAADAGSVDLIGTWEHLDGPGFVYLSIDEVVGSSSRVRGVQLYVADDDEVFFRPDPDRAERVVYERRP
ncbi:hypothetical protein ACFUMH_03955 [Cellulomonas sp. NPDC057328]|uniref:hypothetical protein n=1 Tax=Cellulomonas sp. NPDC057328 TaxID=3346101 RepID=UPI00362848D0